MEDERTKEKKKSATFQMIFHIGIPGVDQAGNILGPDVEKDIYHGTTHGLNDKRYPAHCEATN